MLLSSLAKKIAHIGPDQLAATGGVWRLCKNKQPGKVGWEEQPDTQFPLSGPGQPRKWLFWTATSTKEHFRFAHSGCPNGWSIGPRPLHQEVSDPSSSFFGLDLPTFGVVEAHQPDVAIWTDLLEWPEAAPGPVKMAVTTAIMSQMEMLQKFESLCWVTSPPLSLKHRLPYLVQASCPTFLISWRSTIL